MDPHEFVLQVSIDSKILSNWIEEGWLLPRRDEVGWYFSDIDVARARLIRDLQVIGVNAEGIPIILDLVDQLHGTRYMLRELVKRVRSERQENGPS